MAKGGVNWDSVETWERVVAAILATGVKLDMRAVATAFGTTYDTLENRFRKLKKEAAILKAEVDNGERAEVTPARTKSTAATPRKKTPKKGPLTTVANGKVTKSTPKSKKNSIKKEMEAEEDFDLGDLTNMPSFADMPELNFGHDAGEDDDLLGMGV